MRTACTSIEIGDPGPLGSWTHLPSTSSRTGGEGAIARSVRTARRGAKTPSPTGASSGGQPDPPTSNYKSRDAKGRRESRPRCCLGGRAQLLLATWGTNLRLRARDRRRPRRTSIGLTAASGKTLIRPVFPIGAEGEGRGWSTRCTRAATSRRSLLLGPEPSSTASSSHVLMASPARARGHRPGTRRRLQAIFVIGLRVLVRLCVWMGWGGPGGDRPVFRVPPCRSAAASDKMARRTTRPGTRSR
jgi:hypothetical protein